MNLQIEFKAGRWLVDGKRWEQLNNDERNALNDFFTEYKSNLEIWEQEKD